MTESHDCAMRVYPTTPGADSGHMCRKPAKFNEREQWWCHIHAPSKERERRERDRAEAEAIAEVRRNRQEVGALQREVIQAAITAQRAGRDLGPELGEAVQRLRDFQG